MLQLCLLSLLLISLFSFSVLGEVNEGDELNFAEDSSVKPRATSPEGAVKKQVKKGKKSPWVYSFGVGYHMASTTIFRSVMISGASKTEAAFTSGPAVEVSGNVAYAPRESFGGFGAVTYQTKRQLSQVEYANGSVSQYSSTKPSLQLVLLEFGGLYRWSQFYLPFAFNYSLASYTAYV